MWASGDYPKLAAELVAPLGPVLVDAVGVGSGDRVLDVAAGTGNAAIPAAQTGASVVASDLCPELLEHGRVLAAERGVELEWREANAHALPFGDERVRRRDVVYRRDVRAVPSAGRRRVGPGVPNRAAGSA